MSESRVRRRIWSMSLTAQHRYIDDLEKFIKAHSFKHKDFWERELRGLPVRFEAERSDFEKAGESVRKITAEEAQQALEAYE